MADKLAKKLTWGENRWFLMENSPSLRNRGPRGVQQLFLWTLWTIQQHSMTHPWFTRVLLSDPFEGQVGIWGYGLRAFPFHSLRALNEEMMEGGILHAAGIGQWCGWCLWSGRGLRLQYHVRLQVLEMPLEQLPMSKIFPVAMVTQQQWHTWDALI